MSPQVSVGQLYHSIKQLQIHNVQSNTKNLKECPKIPTGETKTKTCINPYAWIIPMSPRESASWVPKHTSSESIEHPIITTCIHIQEIRQVFSNSKSIQSDNSETSKVKLNSSQEGSGGETPYDPTILIKPIIHQDRDISKSRARERLNT